MWQSWRHDLASMRSHDKLGRQVESIVRILWAHTSREAGISAALAKCPRNWSRWWIERVPYFKDYASGVYDAFWNVELPACCELSPSDPTFVHPMYVRSRAAMEHLYDTKPTSPAALAEVYAHARACMVRDAPSFCRELKWSQVKLPDALEVVEPEVAALHHPSDLTEDRGV